MGTTLTLESDVARMLEDHARRTGSRSKKTLNEAVRLGLSRASSSAAETEFVIDPREMGLRSGIDGARFNSFLNETDADAFLESYAGGAK